MGALRLRDCELEQRVHPRASVAVLPNSHQRREHHQHRVEGQRVTPQKAAHELEPLRSTPSLGHDEWQLPGGHCPEPAEYLVQRQPGPEPASTRELVRVAVGHNQHVARLEP